MHHLTLNIGKICKYLYGIRIPLCGYRLRRAATSGRAYRKRRVGYFAYGFFCFA